MTSNMKLKLRVGTDEIIAHARTILRRLETDDELDVSALHAACEKVAELERIIQRANELSKIEPTPRKRPHLRLVSG